MIGISLLLLLIGFALGFYFGKQYAPLSSQTVIVPTNTPEPSPTSKVSIQKPSPSIAPYQDINVSLPPMGDYCNGCIDAAPGAKPIPENSLIVNSKWVGGGIDSPTAVRKWNYISYIFKGELPTLNEGKGIALPQGDFFREATSLAVNSSKSFNDYNYTRLADKKSKDNLTIYTYHVTPTFDGDSISRKDAIFTKDGYTYYVMFDWKTHEFDNTFDQIISSLTLGK